MLALFIGLVPLFLTASSPFPTAVQLAKRLTNARAHGHS